MIPQNPSTILIKAPNWIGDVLMASFAIQALRRDHPSARLVFFCHKKLGPLCRFLSMVDEVVTHDAARSAPGWFRWVRTVRRVNPDVVVLCPNSYKSALLTRMGTRAPLLGLAREQRSSLLAHAVSTDGELSQEHRTRWYAAICRPLLRREPDYDIPTLVVSDRDRGDFRPVLPTDRPPVAMAVGAAFGPSKEYGIERFAEVSRRLIDRGYRIVVVGTPKERDAGETLRSLYPGDVLNLAGETTLGGMVVLLDLCHGYLGNDSGPMHVAAVLGKPCVGLYGPTDPIWVGPVGPRAASQYGRLECSPCYERVCPLEGDAHMACMSALDPETVVDAFIGLSKSATKSGA